MKKVNIINRSQLESVETFEGEPLEYKIKRIMENNEPITDGAPIIFTEKKDGVVAGYNVRTDRWDVAIDAMDKVNRSKIAKSEEAMKEATEAIDPNNIKN